MDVVDADDVVDVVPASPPTLDLCFFLLLFPLLPIQTSLFLPHYFL